VGVCPHVDGGEPVGPSVDHLPPTHHSHHSADAAASSIDSTAASTKCRTPDGPVKLTMQVVSFRQERMNPTPAA
jgi:hypothetical protein